MEGGTSRCQAILATASDIHVCIDERGLPVRILLGPGQQNDMVPACDLIDGIAADCVLADKAHDADRL